MKTFQLLQLALIWGALVLVPSSAFPPLSSSLNIALRQSDLSTSTRIFQSDQATITKEREEDTLKGFTNRDQAGFSYVQFAKDYPFVNNIAIATAKTAAADLLAQTAIAGTPITDIDLQRSFLFCLFGALYLGAFQYAYQVQVFKRLFHVDKFTSQPWADKLKDIQGLKALGAQTGLDLTVATLIYLPTFYIFKASVFSGSSDPTVWFLTGMDNYQTNFYNDEADMLKLWLPADLVCFSVPLYLRLPVRHIFSFAWTTYLSSARGGHYY